MPLLVALVATVFLNGVNIEGVRSQTFEKCKTVRIDEKGDLYLDCPGYQVETSAQGAAAPAAAVQPAAPAPATPVAAASATPGSITKHYFLVTEQSDGAAAQYDVDVFVNSKWLRKVRSGDEQLVLDITSSLKPGPNKVLFAATKRAPRAGPATSYVKLIVGEGESSGAQVLIDNPLLECKRTAAELDNVNEEFTVQAR
jgi:hypothetical protein